MTNMEDEDRHGEDSRGILPTHVLPSNNENRSCVQAPTTSIAAEVPPDGLVVCSGCQKPISDKYYMWVDKRSWHEACVYCNVCLRPLVQSCYTKNHKLYCQQDYKQLQKCRRCLRFISFNEYVIHVGGMPYHVNCFSCDFCRRQLQSGDQYLVDESANHIYCKSCYAHAEHPISGRYIQDENSVSGSERSDDDVFPHQTMVGLGHVTGYVPPTGLPPHGMLRGKNGSKSTSSLSLIATSSDGKRIKRPRTILTTAQRRKFKASFEVSQKPCRKVRETLAAETGLSPRVVQVWFQNQRAKMKKLARRQQSDGSGQGGSRSGSRNRIKKPTESDSDNELSSSGSYASIPTPHQNAMYPDGYRSPASIPISPTTSTSEVNSYYQQPSSANRDISDMVYEDFDSSILTSGDAFMTQTPHTVTSSMNVASLSAEVRIHSNLNQQMGDFHSPRMSMGLDGDSIQVSSPHHDFHHFNPPQTIIPFENQTQDGNPIDRLMYMQNNFFRT